MSKLPRTKLAALLLPLAMSLAGAGACGGNDKKPATTPTPVGAGTGSDGMATGPDGTGSDGLPTGTGGDDGDNGGGGGSDVAGGGGDATQPPAPPIIPPDLDPDPQVASGQVEQHLSIARAALAQATPDTDSAIKEAKQALAIDASSVDSAVVIAHAYYLKKLYDTAEVVLDDLFKRDAAKNNPRVYYVYGLIYDQSNREPEALLAYQTAVKLDPNYAAALINLGVFQLRNKQYSDAVKTYEHLTDDLHATSAEVYTALGAAYRGHGSDYGPGSQQRNELLSQAEAAFKHAISSDSKYGPAYYDLGLLYLDGDPFPGQGGPNGSMDTLVRLQQAQAAFTQYKDMPGADLKLYDSRNKDTTKAIKHEQNARKQAAADAADAASGSGN